jgi:hypothetical protein
MALRSLSSVALSSNVSNQLKCLRIEPMNINGPYSSDDMLNRAVQWEEGLLNEEEEIRLFQQLWKRA